MSGYAGSPPPAGLKAKHSRSSYDSDPANILASCILPSVRLKAKENVVLCEQINHFQIMIILSVLHFSNTIFPLVEPHRREGCGLDYREHKWYIKFGFLKGEY